MKTIALIIGTCNASEYANHFHHSLTSWGLPSEWIIYLNDGKATKANIIKAFYGFRPYFDSDAKLIFYFAGQGKAKDADSSLILHDDELRLVELMKLIRSLRPLQAFLFIDACGFKITNLINPLDSTAHSKGLFCLFGNNYTNALLKALKELRQAKQPTCHDILKKVECEQLQHNLKIPETYTIGSVSIWPFENHYAYSNTVKENPLLIERKKPLMTLHKHFANSCVIWMWGEAGLGKSSLAEQLTGKMDSCISTSVSNSHSAVQSLIDQIHTQKSELFFNRPAENKLIRALDYVYSTMPNTLFIIDHLDRLNPLSRHEILSDIDSCQLPCLLISRYRCPRKLFVQRKVKEWKTPAFSKEETKGLIEQCGLEDSLITVLQNNTHGNALQTRQLLAKLSGKWTPLDGQMSQESIVCITAIVACGGFIDEKLFCQTFGINAHIIKALIQFGLIRYSLDGCIPHDILGELTEERKWPLPISKACEYWATQIAHTPFNRFACRSLVLLASTLKDCHSYKHALKTCLETLNERQFRSYLLDLAKIFKRHTWESLLLHAIEYLIEFEEYRFTGEVLNELMQSPNESIRYHAMACSMRRSIWTGKYLEGITLYEQLANKALPERLMIAIRNQIGIALFFLGKMEMAFDLLEQNTVLKEIEERELGIALYMSGVILMYVKDDIAQAKKRLESGLILLDGNKSYPSLNCALNGLGDIAYALQKYAQAFPFLHKALEIAKAIENKSLQIFTLRNIARVQLRLYGPFSKELEETVSTLEMLLTEAQNEDPNWATIWAYNTLCTIYAHRKEVGKMATLVHVIASITQEYDDCHLITLSNLGHYAALTENYEEAKKHYSLSYTLCRKIHNPFAHRELRQDFLNCGFPLDLQENYHFCY